MDWNGRRLESISQDGTELISYDYNIDGQRVAKTYTTSSGEVTKTEYFYNGDILAGEKTGDNVIIYMYDNNGDYFGFTYNGTEYYYVKNIQNDVVAIADASGNIIVRYYYDAWGNIIDCQDTSANGIGDINSITYRSYYEETPFGLEMYYLNSRYYLPGMHRFLNADTTDIVGVQTDLYDKNLYAYCDNNPTGRIDSTGYVWETVFDVASIIVSAADVIANPTDPWAWAGLAGDVIDLVPFVTGVGEATKAVKLVVKASDKADGAIDAAKAIYKTAGKTSEIRKATGSYEILYKSGNCYIGKGSYKRAINSAQRNATKYSDEVASISWRSAPNSRTAFIYEYQSMCRYNGPNNSMIGNINSYNQIWSPGRKYYYNDYGSYYYYGGRYW